MTRLWHLLIRSNKNNPQNPAARPQPLAAFTRKQYTRTPLPCGQIVTLTDWTIALSTIVAALAYAPKRRRKGGRHRGNIIDQHPPDPIAAGDATIDHRSAMRKTHLIP